MRWRAVRRHWRGRRRGGWRFGNYLTPCQQSQPTKGNHSATAQLEIEHGLPLPFDAFIERAMDAPLSPGLYIVATPIGNLGDISRRAIEVLAGCAVVACEDTRVTGGLLHHLGLKRPLRRYDDHASDAAREALLGEMTHSAVALVSDAGTPLISDPGYRLVGEALEAGAQVWPIPGASALLSALTVAGLPTDRFLFAGFPPPKSAARISFLTDLAPLRATLIFYEGGSRLAESLADMATVFGPRPASVSRELTKLYETTLRGPLDVLAADPRLDKPKGEIVIVVGPGEVVAATEQDADAALIEALTRMGPSEAAAQVAKALGLERRALYKRALALKGVS